MNRVTFLLLFLLSYCLAAPAAADDRVQFLRNLTVEADETVSDVVCIGCSVTVRGTVVSDVVVIAGNVTVEGTVPGEVIVVGGDVRLLPGAHVGDEIVCIGGRVVRDPAATLGGSVEEIIYFHLPGQRVFHWQGMLVLAGFNFAVVLLGGLILRPRRLKNMADSLRSHYFLTPVLGVLLFLAVAISYDLAEHLGQWEDWGSTVLNFAFLGVPLLGYAGMAHLIGRLGRGSAKPWGILLAGAAATTLLLLLPLLGFLLFLALWVLAFGMIAVSGLGASPHWLPTLFSRRRQPSTA